MSFWSDTSADPALAELLVSEPTLLMVLDAPDLFDDLYAQRATLTAYLSRPAVVRELFELCYDANRLAELPYEQRCRYPFIAARVLALPVPGIVRTLVENQTLLEFMFSVVQRDEIEAATSLGYFHAIAKQLLSEANPHINTFLAALLQRKEALLLPLVERLSRASAEVLTALLLSPRTELSKLQFGLFEYILFFYLNEKYSADQHTAARLENVCAIFVELGARGRRFDYKQKYLRNLFLPISARHRALGESIYALKLTVLGYLADTAQLQSSKGIGALLDNWQSFAESPRATAYLLQVLRCVRLMLSQPDFAAADATPLIERLFALQRRFAGRDVVLPRIFAVLQSLAPFAAESAEAAAAFAANIRLIRAAAVSPAERANQPSAVALPLVLGLLTALDSAEFAEWADALRAEQVWDYRDELSGSNVSTSEVRVVLRGDFGLLGENEGWDVAPSAFFPSLCGSGGIVKSEGALATSDLLDSGGDASSAVPAQPLLSLIDSDKGDEGLLSAVLLDSNGEPCT